MLGMIVPQIMAVVVAAMDTEVSGFVHFDSGCL
jgi:hypothetical protein